MKNSNKYLIIIAVAILIKLFLFSFLVIHAPQRRFQADSADYLETAQVLSSQGAFAKVNADGSLKYEFYRTPGYPAFLALLTGWLKIPLNPVILIQIFLAILAAWFTYKTAFQIDPKIAFLSAIIVLYDPPVAIFSLMILAETLFLLLMAVFMFAFVKYLKDGKISLIILSALALVTATYVRPISYYLGIVVAAFIIYAGIHGKKCSHCEARSAEAIPDTRLLRLRLAMTHALIFLVIVYSLLGVWQERNFKRFGHKSLCAVTQNGYKYFGLYKSYSRNKDTEAKGKTPAVYYAKTSIRSFLYLMTRPGPFKYFNSRIISAVGNAFAYPWLVFWLAGFIIGCIWCGRNIYYQFILLVVVYFIAASIAGVSLLVGERFRVPMMPFIAIISAFGWLNFYRKVLHKN